MRTKRLWARLLGLERAVVETVEIDDEGQIVVAFGLTTQSVIAAASAGAARRAMTAARGGGVGGRWTSARRWPT